MEKLLNERLREIDSSRGVFLFTIEGGRTVAGDGDDVHALADEIERYYIPRPRFEDGEPVQFGDKAADEIFEMGSPVNGMSFYDDGSFSLIGGGSEIEFEKGSFVKRPTPKVYDADGVEITSGTTGWLTDGTKVYVDDVHTDEPSPNGENAPWINVAYGNVLGWCLARDFTYECPVFDAEGVRICKGDTVWLTLRDTPNDGQPFTVKEFGKDGGIIVSTVDGDTRSYSTGILTHQEHDSLEKLRDDILKAEAPFGSITAGKLADRLTALIESGA